MPTPDKPKQQSKPQQAVDKKEKKAGTKQTLKAAAKPPAKKATGKDGSKTKNTAAGALTGMLISSDMAKDLLSNMLYDLLTSGWDKAAPLAAELLHKLPFLQFTNDDSSSGSPQEPMDAAAAGEWIDSVFSVSLSFRKRRNELTRITEEFEATNEDIADLVAERLVNAARRKGGIDVDMLMSELRAHFHHRFLDRTMPPGRAPDRRQPVL